MNFKKAFTMIELIFIIVIIGILSVVVIPKLVITRDDAKIASEMASLKIGLNGLGAEYAARGTFVNYTKINANDGLNCFIFDTKPNGDVSIEMIDEFNAQCPEYIYRVVKRLASQSILTLTGTKKIYNFGGFKVQE